MADAWDGQEEKLESNDPSMGHVLTLLTDPYTGGGAMQGAAPGIGVANRLWLFTDRLPFKVWPFVFLGFYERTDFDVFSISCSHSLLDGCVVGCCWGGERGAV